LSKQGANSDDQATLIAQSPYHQKKYGILLTTMTKAGSREHAHTADWELEVWAPDLPGLLEQAACGMYALSGTRIEGKRALREVELQAADAESLLVRFLSEVLWLGQQDGLAFDTFDMQVTGETEGLSLHARLEGAAIVHLDKEIKAVTYHNLAVRQAAGRLEVNIVFDV
jgi:SHS2 domain-containing protein